MTLIIQKQKISQKKQDGGAINFLTKKFKFINIFLLIYFISLSANSIEKKTITVLRDSEIEFFMQHLINQMLTLHNKKKDSVNPRILLNDEINAFVIGKKNIYINSGLIQNASSIEEIQGVLAHELGHLFLGHIQSRKTYTNRNSSNLAIINGRVFIEVVKPAIALGFPIAAS